MRSGFYDEVVRRNDIVGVARELGLEVFGTKCRCFHPDRHAHGDRTPSLSLNPRTNCFKCWVCPDVHGSVIDLVMQVRQVPFGEAVDYLAGRAGIARPGGGMQEAGGGRQGAGGRGQDAGGGQQAPGQGRPPGSAPAAGPRAGSTAPPAAGGWRAPAPEPKPAVDDERAHVIFSHFLRWCQKPNARGYLTAQRGISLETVNRMHIVWVEDAAIVTQRLRSQFSQEELLGCGLFNQWGLLFRHHRIVFPFTHRERVRFLQGRRLDGREPKYLSIHRPIPCLYNQDLLDTLPADAAVYLCEGVVDTLTLIDRGFPAVGILGVGTVKSEWREALRPFRVLLCLDADAPGQRAAGQLRQSLLDAGARARVLSLPAGIKDVNELAQRQPAALELLRAEADARAAEW